MSKNLIIYFDESSPYPAGLFENPVNEETPVYASREPLEDARFRMVLNKYNVQYIMQEGLLLIFMVTQEPPMI